MSTIVKIKRTTGATAPSTINAGELYYVHDTDVGNSSGQGQLGKRLYIGNEAGNAGIEIGGEYSVSLLDHAHGTLTASSALIVDSNSKIDDLKVDNLEFDGNAITSTDTDGNIEITPNGVGKTVVTNLFITDINTSLEEYIQDTVDSLIVDGDGITFTYDDTANTLTAGISTGGIALDKLAADSIFIGTDEITLGNTTGSYTDINGLNSIDIGNISISGNTIISADADGDITLDPNGNGNINLNATGTGVINANSVRITNLADPTGAQDAVTKAYVDAVKTGLDVKNSVLIATDAELDATYSNGVLTANNNGTINSATGVTGQVDAGSNAIALAQGDRILVKDQTTGADNGIYDVTTVGDASNPFVLTRSADADNSPNAEVSGGMFTFVEDGFYRDSGWVLASPDGAVTLGTDALTFTQFSGAGSLVAGTGLTKTGDTIDVGGSTTIIANADDLEVNSSGTQYQVLLSSGTVGSAATFGALPINETNAISGTLGVPNGGTGTTTFTSNGILYGNGTSALGVTAAGTSGYFLYSNAGTPDWTNIVDGGTYP